jgi:probable phosphoglycerate mutase
LNEGGGRVVLVRHGESRSNVGRVVGGPRGCTGLTDRGRNQVARLADRLADTGELAGVEALYSSVLPRATETADILGGALGLGYSRDCGLCELHPGEADGMTWEQLTRTYGEPDFAARPERPLAPGGESWATFLGRVDANLRALAARHQGETVVVACHGGVIDASLTLFLGVAHQGTRMALASTHASMTEWAVEEGWWRLVRYNDAAHLAGAPAR